MATATTDVDDIRRKMAQIRRDLHEDVKGVVSSAEAATNWRRYIRMYPWAALGVAVAVGYLVVPRRHRNVPANGATDADVAQVRAVVKEAAAKENEAPRKGMIGMALGFLAPIAWRAAQGYAVSYLENWIVQQQQQMAAGPSPADPSQGPGGMGWPGGMGHPGGRGGS